MSIADRGSGRRDLERPAGRAATVRLAGEIGGGLFIAGAIIGAVALQLPHPPEVDTEGFLWLFLGELIFGVVLLAWSRLGGSAKWLAPLTIAGAIVVITVSVAMSGERDGGPALMSELFYVWPALYAGYFFRGWVAAVLVVAIAAAYCVTEVAIGMEASTVVARVLVTTSVVAGAAAVAHALRRYVDALVQRLDRLARTDILTSLINRRGFDECLDDELRRNRRSSEPLSLVLGDIDRFKAINDRFGHAAGDDVLRRVGGVLRDTTRSVDTAARVGGEEFAVLMPATSGAAAVVAAERLRRDIASVTDPSGARIAITFGVASTEDDGCDGSDALLSAADEALYAAKAQGRDRTVAYIRLAREGKQPATIS